MQAKVLQRRRGKTRCIAFLANDHNAQIVISGRVDTCVTAGIKAPFQNISFDRNRTWNLSGLAPLTDRADVNNQGTQFKLGREGTDIDPL